MKLKIVLCLCIALGIFLALPGIAIRLGNEANNKSVVAVADYMDFYKASLAAGMKTEDLFKGLKEAKIKTVALRETTLEDLRDSGEVYASSLGEYLSSLQKDSTSRSKEIRSFFAGGDYSTSGCVAVTGNSETAAFLEKGLKSRIPEPDMDRLDFDGTVLFYFKGGPGEILRQGLGFDGKALEELRNGGFEILLRPMNPPFYGTGLMSGYEDTIRDYGVKYVIFQGDEALGYPEHLEKTGEMIRKYSLITGILEAPSQVRYVEQKGLDSLIAGSGYAINRVYITPQKDLARLTGDDIFHRWVRGVVDRNIRFIYVQPLSNPAHRAIDNVSDTLQAAGRLTGFIAPRGYSMEAPLMKLSPAMPSPIHYGAVALSLLAALALYLLCLFRGRFVLAAAALLLSAAGGVLFIKVFHFNLEQLLAMVASIVYPSFSSLLVLLYLKKNREKPLLKQWAVVLGIVLGLCAMGAYTVPATLSDIRYTMNTEAYKGVLVSFAAPLLLFAANYLSCFVEFKGLPGRIAKAVTAKVSYLAAILAVIALAAVTLYLARSGNDSGIAATSLELRVREFLESALMARPRFKEFLIGYPALFLMVYLYARYKKEILLLPLGLAAIMGGVSIVNSFCHVFTAVEISVQRTVNGFVLGLFFSALAILAVKLILWIYDKYRVREFNGYPK